MVDSTRPVLVGVVMIESGVAGVTMPVLEVRACRDGRDPAKVSAAIHGRQVVESTI